MKRSIFVILLLSLITSIAFGATQVQVFDFLIRGNYLSLKGGTTKANNFRITEYTMIRPTTFMGKGVMLNKRIHHALNCVEKEIKNTCDASYKPNVLSGWRTNDSIRGDEISNHVFGLAIDIDPGLNPCCGCVKEWAKVERCNKENATFIEGGAAIGKYELPECWITAFKKFGWHWLGDDHQLRDTMHFEFVADPDSIRCM